MCKDGSLRKPMVQVNCSDCFSYPGWQSGYRGLSLESNKNIYLKTLLICFWTSGIHAHLKGWAVFGTEVAVDLWMNVWHRNSVDLRSKFFMKLFFVLFVYVSLKFFSKDVSLFEVSEGKWGIRGTEQHWVMVSGDLSPASERRWARHKVINPS
jgi:hypothetical protein